jgi:hypothetical protein
VRDGQKGLAGASSVGARPVPAGPKSLLRVGQHVGDPQPFGEKFLLAIPVGQSFQRSVDQLKLGCQPTVVPKQFLALQLVSSHSSPFGITHQTPSRAQHTASSHPVFEPHPSNDECGQTLRTLPACDEKWISLCPHRLLGDGTPLDLATGTFASCARAPRPHAQADSWAIM